MDTKHGHVDGPSGGAPLRIDAVVLGEAALGRLQRGERCQALVVGGSSTGDSPDDSVDGGASQQVVSQVRAALGEAGRSVALGGARPPSPSEAALAAVTEGVLIAGVDRRITHANPALQRITGYGEAELLGQPLSLLWGELTDAVTLRRVHAALDERRSFSAALLGYRKEGQTFWHQFSLTPVLGVGGDLAYFVAVVRDVTVAQQLEEQLRHAQKLDAIDQLSGGVAHDFNNLLTIITGNIELLEASQHDVPGIADPLHEISQAASRAADLTRQLLMFGRKQVRDARVLDLTVVVDQMVAMLRRIVGEGIRMDVDHRLRPALVRADQGMIEQILMNLCFNARDAMPGGGRLQIAIEASSAADIAAGGRTLGTRVDEVAPGPLLRLSVTDSGVGIPVDTRSRVFEPFFTTKGAGKGTGLGLATVASIARQHGGACAIESEPGRGTRVFVWLPVADAVVRAAEDRPGTGHRARS